MTKTHTMRSRLISLVLVLVMVLGCLPLSALAADPPTSSFDEAWTSGAFRMTAGVSSGYTLQTVSGSNPTQNTKLDLTVLVTSNLADTYEYFYIDLQDSNGNNVRRIMWSGFAVSEDPASSGNYKFTAGGSATSMEFAEDGSLKNDANALQPKVSISADGKYAYIRGIAYTVEGAGTFPVYAKIGYKVNGDNAVTLDSQRIGTFNIASYSDDVMTKNLTFNLDATDAYYAYSTVAMVANEKYVLPTVTPIREHYTFKEWKLDDTSSYKPGDEISDTLTGTDLMLTAVWELDQVSVDYPATLPTGVAYDTPAPSDDNVGYGTVQSFDLVLDEGYDPATLFVTANDVLLAPVNYVLGADGKVTYTYSFTATDHTTIAVSDDLAKLSYVVTMPVGHFTAKLTGNGITSETSTTVEYGGSYTFTVDPEDGYKIMGVYVNGDKLTAGGTGNNEYTVTTVTGPQVVEVVVEEIPNYTVTYVVNDKQYTTQVVADGEKVAALPEAPVVTGYEFVSWNTKQDGSGDEFNANTAVSVNITVYAQLEAKTYTITYNSNGGSDTVTGMPASGTTKTYGQPVQLNTATPSREGYTFLGWSRNENATEATYAAGDYFTEEITTATTLYAVWKANTYTITLPTGTGYTVVAQSENVVGWGEDFKFYVYVDRGYVENTPVVAVNGVQLAGTGRDNASGTKTYEYTISNIQENKVVTITVAKNKTYTVDFQVQGASYLTQEVEYGYCATVPAAPVVEGYTFRGWTTDKANEYPYDFTTPVTEDLTLYAHLEKITYTVKLPTDADGYDVNPNGDQTVDWNGSQEFTVTVEEGYSDANMVVSANGTPLYPIGKTGSTYTYKIFNIKADQEVYVVGVERKTVTITYNDNGGVGGPTQQVANYYVATASDNSEVSTIEPTRDGYVFQGWAYTNTATANDVVYKHGVDDKDTLKETTDTTLYAVWARAESKVELEVEPDEQFEGSEVTLTATVSSGGTGSVLFYRSTDDANSTADDDTLVGTSDVSGDKATATVAVKDYAAGAATDYFYAVFKPTDGAGYTETPSNVVSVTVKSTTIVFGDGDTADDPIVKHWVTGSGLEDVAGGQMVVGETYHLQVPAIYAEDDTAYASPLDAETVTDIVWQYRLPNGEWQTIVTNDRVSIKVTPDVIGMEYRAILTPKGDYKGEALKTDETKPVLETETTVDLTVAPTEQYEGKDVTLTAAVTTNDTVIGEGSVQFYLNDAKIGQPVPVNTESGVATLTWTTSAYSTAADATNKDVYYAEYLGTATYDAGTSSEVEVTVRSAAISWKLDTNGIVKGADKLTIKETVDDQTNTVTEMVAGHTYTLELPDVYALDNMNDEVSEYTVTWQKKDAQQDWVTVADAGDTYTVTSYKVGDEYRAVVTPADPYTKAQAYNTDGTLADGYVKTLIADTGVTVKLQPTTTTLEVSDTHDIAVDDGSVLAEFEGQNVTLTATVVDQSTKAAVTTGYVQFYKDNGDGNFDAATDTKIGEPVAVNGNNGTATIEATMSEYEPNTSDVFFAEYQTNETYDKSVGYSEDVAIRSTAIAWGKLNDSTENMALTITDLNTNTVLGEDDILVAGHTYQLDLPDVYERDRESIGALTVNKDYRVDWYQFNADATQGELIASLVNLDTVTVKPETDGVGYYAIVTPVDGSNYTKAWTVVEGDWAYNNFLITATEDRSGATPTEIVLTIDGAVAMNNSWEQYEGRTITLNAKVNVEGNTTTMVEHGNVSFYVITKEDESQLIGGQPVAVENGMASVTYELPEYLLNEGLENIEYFYAVYEDVSTELSGEVRYASSTTATVANLNDKVTTENIPAKNQLQVRSIAITWELTDDKSAIADGANDITIYNYDAATGGKGTQLGEDEVMDADKSYVLEMPAVYAYDAVTGTTEPLAIGTDYTVQWQYYVEDTESWMGYKGKDAYSASIVVTPEYHDYGFRVQVTPKYDNDSLTGFRKAAKYDGNAVAALDFQVLYSDTTVPTDRKATATDLAITGADWELQNVMVDGKNNAFTADHYAQFEGQTVTLKATVTEADAPDVMIPDGYVYFYRYEGERQTVLLNATPVEVKDGIAELEVKITSYDVEKDVTENADKFFAVYEPNNTYDGSTSTTTNAEGAYLEPAETDWVYIKSTSINTPIVESALPGKIDGKEAKATTYTDDLTELQAGVEHTFKLRQEAKMDKADYSVVALDGRYVEKSNYTIQWLVKNGDNEETTAAENVNPYVTTTTKTGDMYRLWLKPKGDMTEGAYSKHLIVGTKQLVNVTVVASDEIKATEETDVYQRNDITLTATVEGAEPKNTMKPTGTVTFYYRTKDTTSAWTEIGEAALAEDSVTGKMVATLVTDELPVDAEAYTKRDLQIYAIYNGDETFQVSATAKKVQDEELFNIAGTEGSATVDDTVTVYSSVVLRSSKENKAYTPDTAPDGKDGLMAYVDGNLMVNEENVTLMLSDLYTLDGAEVDAVISKLTHGTDYTIIWQELTNYESYKNANLNDAPWTNLNDSDTHQYNVNVKQGAAYRAMITVKDTAPVQGSFTEVLQADADDATSGSKIYYTNILVPTLGQSTLSYNITSSVQNQENSEGIVEGETATVHVYINGATETTPISSLTVSITKKGETEPVYTDTRYSVNGYTAIDWQTEEGDAGYYTLTIEAVPSNGYEPETLTRTIIVRDNTYTLNVSNLNPTYNGKTQGVSVTVEGMDIEADLAAKSWTVTYTDANGNKVEPSQAGTYTYTATLPASAYWTEKTVEGTFTIEKRQVSVADLVAQAKVYDGTTDVNLLEIVLDDADTAQSTTGLPTNKLGVINGDSVYATGTGYTASANAGTTELGVKDVELKGDDAGNYILNSTSYTEVFNIQRNQLQGDVADATYQYTGSSITVPADDIYLIDQQGNVVTDYTVTYYYHNGEGVEKVAAMKDLGMYTIVVNKDPANYKGGASQIVYVSNAAQDAAPSKDFESATVDITNTVELYGESTGIVATASTGTVSTIEYRVGTAWTTTVPTNAGRYLVKVTTSTDDVAYGIYTIVKANPVLTLNAAGTTYDSALYEVSNVTGTYNGGTFGELDYYYTYAGDVVIGEHGSDSGVNVDFQAPHDAGTYVVTVHVPETDNYTAEEYSTSFTIAPKELVIKANDKQRHLYSAYPDMLATYEGLATDGVAMDTSLRDIQIMPEFNYDNHNNDSESHVGYYTVTPVDALAKNYVVVDYVPGEFSVNENDPQPTLSIVGAPQNGMNDGKTYAYYGDVIQLYAYGNQKDGVINKSSVLTWEVVSGHAVIDQTGLLTITGTGDIVVKLTRGTGRTAISTELTITALKKEVQVIVPDQDLVYNGASQTYTGVMTAVDDAYNAVNADLVTITESNKDRAKVGSQIVTGIVAQDGNLYYQSETYGGLFTINDKEIKIEPVGKATVYGTKVEGLTYREVTPVNSVAALTDGYAVSVADYYNNLDVLDGYEILVAGRENINYNVKYVTDQTAEDVKVTEKALTIKTGSYADTIGKTGGSLNPAGDYPVNGAIVDPAALFETDGMRMYGEPNQVMGFVLETLIDGDSVADVNALLDWLVEFDIDDHYLIDEDANITYPTKDTTKDHVVELDGTVRNYDLHIGTEMDFHNYDVTVQEGTQNIYQRPVTLTTRNGITLSAFRDSILDGSNPDQDAILEILLNNLVVGKYNGEGGLATLLNHTIEDLDIRIVSAVYTPSSDPDSTSAGTIKVTIKLGNVNYWTEDLIFDIDVTKVNIKPVYGPLGRTSSYVTMTKDGAPYDVDGKVFYLIYKKADGDDGSWSYADYRNLTPVVNVEMVKNPYITGRYTATYDALPNGDYVMFAIAENYTIV